MPTDIADRADQERDALETLAAEIDAALVAARPDGDPAAPALDRAIDAYVTTAVALAAGKPDPADPDLVDPDDWADAFSPGDHLALARGVLGGVRDAQARVRAELATVTTPADTDRLEAELRALLIEDAARRVDQRHAAERVAIEAAESAALTELKTEAEAVVRAAVERAEWADEHHTDTESLRTRLGDAPLDTVVVDADAARTGNTLGDADDRLAELLPDELRQRAQARAAEAVAMGARHDEARIVVDDALDDLAREAQPLLAEVHIAERDYLAAKAALGDYVVGAAARLAVATNLLGAAAGHADLTAAQAAVLDSAANAAGVAATATATEADLAAALADLHAAEQVVEDAVLAALVDDPDGDPETVQHVIAARDALAAAAVQDPLTAARAAHGDAEVADLDGWEVEVPKSLWKAVADVELARATLDELADQAALDQLLTDLDDAEAAWAEAIDDWGSRLRATWRARIAAAGRRARAEAATRTAADRRIQYVRGDGDGGRTADER